MNQSLDTSVARFTAQEEGLTYDFEFQVGRDIGQTLPAYLSSFASIVPLKSVGEGANLDYVLDPDISSTLFVYIGMSAAPRYDLSMTLNVPMLRNGSIQERFVVAKNSRVTIGAYKNTSQLRDSTMRQAYEEQLTAMYNELEMKIRGFLAAKPLPQK